MGANGQLGSRIAGEMSSAGWDVTALTRSSKDRVEALEGGVRVVEGFDTTDVDDEGVLRMASGAPGPGLHRDRAEQLAFRLRA